MPCFNGWLDEWRFDECDSNGACRISQSDTCLGAYRCDPTQLRLLDCSDAATPLRCQRFKLSSQAGTLVHASSGMCAAELVQTTSIKAQVAVGEGEQEKVAQLVPCGSGDASVLYEEVSGRAKSGDQKWKYAAGQLVSPSGE